MGTLAVVVIDVLPKNQSEVALAKDEQPVQGFVAERLDHTLAMGVRSRTAVGRESDLGAFAAEHLVELVDELGISVVYGELDRALEDRAVCFSWPKRAGCAADGFRTVGLRPFQGPFRIQIGGGGL